MIRSKIDEIRLLRSTNFKRPTSTSYFSSNQNRNFRHFNRLKNSDLKKTILPDNLNLTKTPNNLNKLEKLTPESTKSHLISTLSYISSSPNKYNSNFPYKIEDFLKRFRSLLNKHEAIEILDYITIYYWIKSENSSQLFKYNDESGYLICNEHDHIAYKYQVIKTLGKGTFGQVFEAYDHKDKIKVAIKIIKSHKKFVSQAHNEVQILKIIRDNFSSKENFCVELKDYFIFRGHICIVTELLGDSLLEVCSQGNMMGGDLEFVKGVVAQILHGLRFLRKLRIIHCDLKPENILRCSKSQVKIADFGSSCLYSEKYFSYIQSRNYRSPEIILGCPFDYQIDIWSLGCIVYELITGTQLFNADSELDLLHQIQHLKGEIPKSLKNLSSKSSEFFTSNTLLPNISEKPSQHPFSSLPKDPLLLDFLNSCLEIDPKSRITASQALCHKWIQQLSHSKDLKIRIPKQKTLIITCL